MLRNRLLYSLIALVTYGFLAYTFHLPPSVTVYNFLHRDNLAAHHRPGIRKTTRSVHRSSLPSRNGSIDDCDRYSKEHRYRPAASPVITKKSWSGKKKLHGDYHEEH